ncbi:hypothetical protein [Endozoicomonas sp. ONNA1]|uniref:hypothetical protein n=1 Tax=Endozoicomonas sp. ONNA1 TaxID=2828740 RepID=UPI0021488B15|nr:hypothetical protein [Endozoicomonas sp. ONNA1]
MKNIEFTTAVVSQLAVKNGNLSDSISRISQIPKSDIIALSEYNDESEFDNLEECVLEFEEILKSTPQDIGERLRRVAFVNILIAYWLAHFDIEGYEDIQDVYMRKLSPSNQHRLSVWIDFHKRIESYNDNEISNLSVKKSVLEDTPHYTEEQKTFLRKMECFDKYYAYSDCLSVYKVGKAREEELEEQARQLGLLNEWRKFLSA